MREHGYDVKIFCCEAYDDIVRAVISYQSDYIGFNTVTINIEEMANLAEKITENQKTKCIFFWRSGCIRQYKRGFRIVFCG